MYRCRGGVLTRSSVVLEDALGLGRAGRLCMSPASCKSFRYRSLATMLARWGANSFTYQPVKVLCHGTVWEGFCFSLKVQRRPVSAEFIVLVRDK
jgi:hypothetical protein